MTIIQKLRARSIIRTVAARQGISTAQCRAEMAEAIREAWNSADPAVKQRQIDLAGEGSVPTPEEFILRMAESIR